MDDGLAYAETSIRGKLIFITCAILQKILAKTCGRNPAIFGKHGRCHEISDAFRNPTVAVMFRLLRRHFYDRQRRLRKELIEAITSHLACCQE